MVEGAQHLLGHVALDVNALLGVLGDLVAESLLNLAEDLLILLGADEADGHTLGTETTGTTDTVKVAVGIGGQVVVDGQVDTLNVDTTAEDVGGDTDALLEVLELLVALDTLLLADTGVHGDGGEVALPEKLVELGAAKSGLDEDNDLVVLQLVKEVVEFAVLLGLGELDVELLETVKGELRLLLLNVLAGVAHELPADGKDLLGKSGGEHHNLLLGGSDAEDLLHVAAHVNLVEHLVTLIEHEALDVAQAEVLVAHKGVQTTGSGDNDVRVGLLVLENVDVVLNGSATVEDRGLDVGQVLAETGVLILDLESQLAGVAHDQHRALAVDRLDLLKSGQDENGSFTKTRLGLAKDVGSENCLRNAVLLDCGYRMSDIGQKIIARARASCRSISEIKLFHLSNNIHTT